jgi:hypothetical protein
MNKEKQNSVLKDLKTAVKFIRIAKTMMDNIKNDIAEENDKSVIINRLDNHIQSLESMSNSWNDCLVDEFKYEQKMPGCQLKLF